ncbi:immunoglobulin-like domain-containing protein [uncultured Ruminococcus sp.]|uniref:immunoglobulin-like domain-containing protein n=1 Tax=uncultured Ruminococcus sp. TaxID=165186 RepID=UPI0025FD65F8|nr:immunoglobulin-like domain-containing protein [uncultured Ruminococcus sp.]
MKKIIAIALLSIFVLALVSCGSNTDSGQPSDNDMQYDWGITLTAENVTPSGLTLVCEQSGGENIAQLETGSSFVVQKKKKSKWKDVDYIIKEDEFGWTMEARILPKESTAKLEVDWEWLYGKLPSGDYRIGKEFMNFRDTGDFDKDIVYAEFKIE